MACPAPLMAPLMLLVCFMPAPGSRATLRQERVPYPPTRAPPDSAAYCGKPANGTPTTAAPGLANATCSPVPGIWQSVVCPEQPAPVSANAGKCTEQCLLSRRRQGIGHQTPWPCQSNRLSIGDVRARLFVLGALEHRTGLFSQHQQGCRLGQCFFLSGQLLLQLAHLVSVHPRGFFQMLFRGTVPVVGLLTSRAPGDELIRVPASLAAVPRDPGLTHGRRFHHSGKFVPGCPTLRGIICIRQQPTLVSGLLAPVIKGCVGYAFFFCQCGNRLTIGGSIFFNTASFLSRKYPIVVLIHAPQIIRTPQGGSTTILTEGYRNRSDGCFFHESVKPYYKSCLNPVRACSFRLTS